MKEYIHIRVRSQLPKKKEYVA